jgi:mono/diheme cytochrome c family protein
MPSVLNQDVDISMTSAVFSRFQNLVMVACCVFLMACGTGTSDPGNTEGNVVTEPEAPTTPEPTEKTGAEYFYSYCRGCHEAQANGTHQAPQLHFIKEDYARWIIRNGRYNLNVRMPQFGEESLTETQLDEIIVWLSSFERPTTGAGLYRVFCEHCHGADATGGEVRKDITNDITTPSLVLDMIRRGSGGTDYLKRSDYMPARSEEELSGAEAQLIIEYIQEIAGL